MGEQKRMPGRPRKWASDAERMRATRAAQRAEREAASQRTTPRSSGAGGRDDDEPVPIDARAVAAIPTKGLQEPSRERERRRHEEEFERRLELARRSSLRSVSSRFGGRQHRRSLGLGVRRL